MPDSVEEKLLKIPFLGALIRFSKRIILPGFEGLSLYDLLDTYVSGIAKGTFSSRASGIAFSFFMALFPFVLFVLNLIPYVKIDNFQQEFLLLIEELLPAQTAAFFYPILLDIAANPRGSLLSFTLILAIFLMTNGVNAIFSGFEFSYHVQKKRSIVRQYLIALGVSMFLAFMLFVFVIMLIIGQYVIFQLNREGMNLDDIVWIAILRYLLFLVLIYIIIATLYYFGTKESKKSRFFSIGAFLTTLLFMLTTYFFTVYINNFSNYNELYGSIGALLIMMLYIWINSNLLLLGFELNATIYKLKCNFKTS
ncbi:MAG: ribonuclease BN [Flavobacteriaceae bacterium CG_4_8_14_3_um_filter_34_10]|nr:YihY/virulence factor BrkB family protein [Flavobacteriia bacterium]OIP50803.1 MAG: ribonuclease BN [Flavobacteriaceae bacterium CG2_30_34_30]PIQ17590.1 MAG: ribonuclease BN [Flavobacteriaceae bacterium CG18_big_fil_WC_8_21_14_2_50_34_36]PIV49086.1 MAG: ribonuclease BN [Flavobacteriaceae bacterium CG02_land_8_20_14_3_00_34_13]PIX09434.1 MAG: ribonuclease BN [Flavobacteriaceae bacterium CG_4_8_14_3_um_filter_34_10]PIZ08454.1 MAG: ribonuclease BN [Flavobacteriaceae bacterium CG_4_10_14_0_8_um